MLVAGVDVGLGAHAADAVKVMDVNVHKDPEQTTQHLLAHLLEVLWEGNTWREGKGKYVDEKQGFNMGIELSSFR